MNDKFLKQINKLTRHFGTQENLAKFLGQKRPSISQYKMRGYMPLTIAMRIETKTNGNVKAKNITSNLDSKIISSYEEYIIKKQKNKKIIKVYDINLSRHTYIDLNNAYQILPITYGDLTALELSNLDIDVLDSDEIVEGICQIEFINQCDSIRVKESIDKIVRTMKLS